MGGVVHMRAGAISSVCCLCRGEGRPVHPPLCSPPVLTAGSRKAGYGEID